MMMRALSEQRTLLLVFAEQDLSLAMSLVERDPRVALVNLLERVAMGSVEKDLRVALVKCLQRMVMGSVEEDLRVALVK